MTSPKTTRLEHHKQTVRALVEQVMRDELSLTNAKHAAIEKTNMKSLYAASQDFAKASETYSKRKYDDQKQNGRHLLSLYVTGPTDAKNTRPTDVDHLMRALRKRYQNVHGSSRLNLNRSKHETRNGVAFVHQELKRAEPMASVALFEHLHPERLSIKLMTTLLDPDVPYVYTAGTPKKCYFTPNTVLISNYRSIGAWLVASAYHNGNRATYRAASDQTLKPNSHAKVVAMCRTLPFVLRTEGRHEDGKCLVLYQFDEMRASVHSGPVTARDVESWYVDVRRFPYNHQIGAVPFADIIDAVAVDVNQRHLEL